MTHSPSPPTQPKGIPIRAAAAQIPCCTRILRKAIAQGRLLAYRIGRRIFIRPEDFETYVQNREIPIQPDGLALDASTQSAPQGEPSTIAAPTAAQSEEESHDQ